MSKNVVSADAPNFAHEQLLWNQGLKNVAGIDEAGRGPLAGPVVAASVILDPENYPLLLNDSKKLTDARREELFPLIMESAKVAIGVVDHKEIDRINILKATQKAMVEAGLALADADAFLIDGNIVPSGLRKVARAVVSGDALSLSIAAASIVAKVTRDRIMREYAEKYPGYGFEVHMGYPTKAHVAAIKKLGPTPIHRMTFGPLKGFTAFAA